MSAPVIELIDELEAAGRAFDNVQARLYEATRLSDVRRILRHEGRAWGIVQRILRHEGRAWGIVQRQLWIRALDDNWYYESYADGGGNVAVRRASDTLSIVAEHDDENDCTAHVLTTALRDDAAATRGAGR